VLKASKSKEKVSQVEERNIKNKNQKSFLFKPFLKSWDCASRMPTHQPLAGVGQFEEI
jgi:hypothetical protein